MGGLFGGAPIAAPTPPKAVQTPAVQVRETGTAARRQTERRKRMAAAGSQSLMTGGSVGQQETMG
tara:strand:- start:5499 stop:5693 length:195 start_codon:yes stop_codon:yes gene_type:complete